MLRSKFKLGSLLIIFTVTLAFYSSECLAQRGKGKRRQKDDSNSLKVGQEAPTFKLKSLDGESETDLASFKGKKPVVLIFGSYT